MRGLSAKEEAMDFEKMLNWRLLEGSHEFPGPDGGTCINEAAVVAAGMPYRRVWTIYDCPPCFSRPLAELLLNLNDEMEDDERGALIRFVMRLPGSADSPRVEQERMEHLTLQLIRKFLAPHFPSLSSVRTAEEASEALASLRPVSAPRWALYGMEFARVDLMEACRCDAEMIPHLLVGVISNFQCLSLYDSIWGEVMDLIEEAFAIGRQSSLSAEVAADRMTRVMEAA